jgi:hypothetical protein
VHAFFAQAHDDNLLMGCEQFRNRVNRCPETSKKRIKKKNRDKSKGKRKKKLKLKLFNNNLQRNY